MSKKKKIVKMKLATTIEPEVLAKLEEIRVAYIRQGEKVKTGEIIGEAITRLWQEVCKK